MHRSRLCTQLNKRSPCPVGGTMQCTQQCSGQRNCGLAESVGTSWSRSSSVFAPSLANSAMRRGWLIRLPVNANGVGRIMCPVPPPVRHFSSSRPGLFTAGGGGGTNSDETCPAGEPALFFLWLFSEFPPQQPAASARLSRAATVQHPSRRSPAMSLQRTPRNVSARAKRCGRRTRRCSRRTTRCSRRTRRCSRRTRRWTRSSAKRNAPRMRPWPIA